MSNSVNISDEVKAAKPAAGGLHYGIWILITGTLTNFGCVGLGRFAIGMIIPEMGKGLGLTNTQIGVIVSGTFLGYLVSTVVSGALSTRFGPRKVIGISMVLVSAGMALAGFSSSFTTTLIGQLVIGVGAGGSNVPTFGLVARWYSERLRGMASGLTLTGSGLGFALAGVFIPYLIALYGGEGWRASWFYLSVIVLIIAFLGMLVFRNDPAEISSLPVGDTGEGFEHPQGWVNNDGSHWKEVYLSNTLWKLGLTYFMFGFSYVVFTTFYAKYMIEDIGFTQALAGKIWFAIGAVSLISGFIWGILSDKIGRKSVIFMLYFLQGISLFAIALTHNQAIIIIASLIYALTLWGIPSVMAAACADYAGGKLAPAAIGMVTIFFGIGQVISPWMSGFIKDATDSFTIPFMVSAGVGLAGAALTVMLPKRSVA